MVYVAGTMTKCLFIRDAHLPMVSIREGSTVFSRKILTD